MPKTPGPPPEDSPELWKLFHRYSAELGRVTPALTGQFRCPLCLTLFKPIPGQLLRDILAPEHVVPDALGGRITTLSCRRCNNTTGSNLEKHLIQRARIDNRQVPIKARIQIGDAEHGAEIMIPEDPRAPGSAIVITGVEKWSDARQVEKAKQAMGSQPPPTIRFHANFGYVHRRSEVALLRAAHLMMFRTFGYEYLDDPSTALVLEQLKNPRNATPILGGIMWRIPDPPITDTCVTILVDPPMIQSFFVVLKLSRDPLHLAGVVLPPPGSTDETLYDRLQSADASGPKKFQGFDVVDGFLPFRRAWDIALSVSRV